MLDKIIKFSIKNKLIIAIFMLGWVAWGVWSLTRLSIDAVPDITNNQVQIITISPTLASQEVEQFVTFPIEQAIANIPNKEEVRSISRFGLSVITVVFKDDVNIYFARQLIQEQLKLAEEEIPEGVGKPELAPVSTGLGEVYQYILHPKKGSEKKYTTMDLRTMQDWIVRRQLNGTPGVAEINSFGGLLKQYEVSVDPEQLKAFNVSISDIFTALEQNNQNTGGAYIDKKPNAYFIRSVGMVSSLEDIKNIAITKMGRSPLYLRDIATVQYGSAIRYGAMTYNGEIDAVGGVVMMLKGENSKKVVNQVKERLKTIQKSLPDDVVIEPYLDRTHLVDRAIKTIQTNLIEGALIVIFVLVIFLGNFRAGLIVASAIPLSMLFAIALMNIFGVSANLMSLGAIDFGLIVDGSVIIVETTLHHLHTRKNNRKMTQKEMDEEVYVSASKIRTSAAFGEIIILIVYIPILVLRGVEGKMFVPMAQTVGFAILGALILSLTYIPMMCALFLPKQMTTKRTFSDRLINWIYSFYRPVLNKAVSAKKWVIGSTLVIFAFSAFIFSRMGGEFIPTLKEGDFAFHCILPKGASLSQSMETSMLASRLIKEFDEVAMVVGKTGSAEVPTDPMPPEATDLMIILKPKEEWKSDRSFDELGEAILAKLETNIPGVFFEKNQPIQMRTNELMTGIRQDVAVKIFGENLDTLTLLAKKMSGIIQTVQGASSPQVENIAGLPQITVTYNRVQLANNGITVAQVNDILSAAFAGKITGAVYENERKFDLVIRLNETYRQSIDNVSNLFIPNAYGVMIPLHQLATVSYKSGPAQISREEGKRRIVIGFNTGDGRDVASVVKDIQTKTDTELKLPLGYYLTYGGSFENLQEASARLTIAVPVSLALIFFLLYLTFHSAKQALLIFTAIPMSAIGGIFALVVRGMPFSISAGIGFIALFGVAVLNGIVLIGTFNNLRKEGITDALQRVIIGTKERLRPVLMTATVASLGFLPMALSTGDGAEVQKPLATVVIGGLVSATLLTLLVLPVLYILFNKKWSFRMSKKIKNGLSVLFFIMGSASVLNAQSINKEKAIAIGLQHNALVQAKSLEVEAQKALLATAGEMPKTELQLQLGQFVSNAFDQNLEITQTIPFPAVFKSKRQLIQSGVDLAEWNKKLTENELKYSISFYYDEANYYFAYGQLLQTLDSLYQDFVQSSKVKYTAGDVAKLELTTAETKQGEIRLRLQQNQVDYTNTIQHLKMLMRINEEVVFNFSSFLPHLLSDTEIMENIDQNPNLQLVVQQMNMLEASKDVERKQNLPEFVLGYANTSMIGSSPTGNNLTSANRFHSAIVGINIPIFNSGVKARIKNLEFQQQAQQALVDNTRRDLETQLANAFAVYQQNKRAHEFYQSTGLKNAEEIKKAAKLGYTVGDMDYIEYILTLQNAIDIEVNYLNTVRTLNQSVNQLYYILSK